MKMTFRDYFSKYFLLIATLALIVMFSLTSSSFLSLENMMNILRTASVYGIAAMGLATTFQLGEMNLAASAQASTAAVITGMLLVHMPNAYLLCCLIAIVISVLVGMLPASCIIKLRTPPFITTMAFMTLITGFNRMLTGNQILYETAWGSTFTYIGSNYVAGFIPIPVVIFAVIVIGMHFFYERTRYGRYIFAVGANRTACEQFGINVVKVKYIGYIICSVLWGIAGIVQGSILGQVDPDIGHAMLLPCLAASILSATFYKVGKYNAPGVCVAAIIMMVVKNGIMGMGLISYIADIVQGGMLIIAVGMIARIRKEALPHI